MRRGKSAAAAMETVQAVGITGAMLNTLPNATQKEPIGLIITLGK